MLIRPGASVRYVRVPAPARKAAYPEGGHCCTYDAAWGVPYRGTTGDTAWLLLSTMAVFLMTGGVQGCCSNHRPPQTALACY